MKILITGRAGFIGSYVAAANLSANQNDFVGEINIGTGVETCLSAIAGIVKKSYNKNKDDRS